MKYITFFFLIALTNNAMANPEIFVGAFGLNFGDVLGSDEQKKCRKSGDVKECDVVPKIPYHEFSLYGAKLTKNTNKIYNIFASARSDNYSHCISKASSIAEKVQNKYKIKFIVRDFEKTKYQGKQKVWVHSPKNNLQKSKLSKKDKGYYQSIEIRCIDKSTIALTKLPGLLNIEYEDASVILNERSDDSGL